MCLMDLTIPGGLGAKEAAEQILSASPKAFLVVSSGYSNDPAMADYMKYGFKGVMLKPYSLQQLSSILREILGNAT